MPQNVIPTTANGWPQLDKDNYLDVIPTYTQQLAVKLDEYGPDGLAGPPGPPGPPGHILAAGRPDIPATLDAPTKLLVAAATTGTEFRSTNGPQGAWVWMKRGTSWMVTEGKTGVRNVAGSLLNGWTGTTVYLSRTESSVEIQSVNRYVDTLNGVDSTSFKFLEVPLGFRKTTQNYSIISTWAPLCFLTQEINELGLKTTAQEPLKGRAQGSMTWVTADAWPTTLPGTPA